MSSNQVAVIGGGVSGLVAAKVLKGDGFDVSIFEKAPEVGGVWGKRVLGRLPLPAVADMEKSVDEVLDWTARHFPNQREGTSLAAMSHSIQTGYCRTWSLAEGAAGVSLLNSCCLLHRTGTVDWKKNAAGVPR